jgi:PhnB protein
MDQSKIQPITPYLTVRGATDAIAFYHKAFGAKENTRMPAHDGKRLMHADLTINGGRIMLADEFPECCEDGALAPSVDKPAGVAVSLTYGSPAEVDVTFRHDAAARHVLRHALRHTQRPVRPSLDAGRTVAASDCIVPAPRDAECRRSSFQRMDANR